MKKKIFLFSAIGVFVIALAVVLIVVLGNKNKNNTETEARIITITEIINNNNEGKVTINNNGNTSIGAVGVRLKAGDVVTTDENCACYFTCDNDKVFRLSHNSSIEITVASSKKLAVKLVDGDIYFNVKKKLADDEELDVVAGSTTMSVRGTIGNITFSKEHNSLKVLCPEGKLQVSEGESEQFATPGYGVSLNDGEFSQIEASISSYPVNLLYEVAKDPDTLERVINAFSNIVDDKDQLKEDVLGQAEITDSYVFTSEKPEHVHNFSEYESNDTYHYKVCSCGENTDREKHVFAFDEANTTDKEVTVACSVCGRSVTLENPFYKEAPVVNNYTIHFSFKDNLDKAYDVEFKENEFPKLEVKEIEGYNFIGFYENDEIITEIDENRDYNIVCVYEKIVASYTIYLYLDSESDATIIRFNENEFPKLEDATKEGYTFLGWYEGETKVETISENRNYNLVGKWERMVNSYTISLDIDGEKQELVFEEGKFPKLNDLTKEGYNFLGWYEGETKVETISENRDYNLVAKFEKIIVKYSIKYSYDDKEETLEFDEGKYPELKSVSKEGYNFLGWYEGETKIESITENRDYNLVASFEKIIVKYSIKYSYDDKEETVEFDEGKYPELKSVSKEGYNFLGWFEGETKVEAITENRNYNLVASFELIISNYTITISYSGISLDSYTINFSTNKFPDLTPTDYEGYDFVGWFENGLEVTEINENRDYSLVAVYDSNEPKVIDAFVDISYSIVSLPINLINVLDEELMYCKMQIRTLYETITMTMDELYDSEINVYDTREVYVITKEGLMKEVDLDFFFETYSTYLAIRANYYIFENGEFRKVNSYDDYISNITNLCVGYGKGRYYKLVNDGFFYDSDYDCVYTENVDYPYFIATLIWNKYVSEDVTPSHCLLTSEVTGIEVPYGLLDFVHGTIEIVGNLTGVAHVSVYGYEFDFNYTYDQSFLNFNRMYMEVGSKISDYFNPNNIEFGAYSYRGGFTNLGTVRLLNESDLDRVIEGDNPIYIPLVVTPFEGHGSSVVMNMLIYPVSEHYDIPWPEEVVIKVGDGCYAYSYKVGDYSFGTYDQRIAQEEYEGTIILFCDVDYYTFFKEVKLRFEEESVEYMGETSFEGEIGDYLYSIELQSTDDYSIYWKDSYERILEGEHTYTAILYPYKEGLKEKEIKLTVVGTSDKPAYPFTSTPVVERCEYLSPYDYAYIDSYEEGGYWTFADPNGIFTEFGETTVELMFIPNDNDTYRASTITVSCVVGPGSLYVNYDYVYPSIECKYAYIGTYASELAYNLPDALYSYDYSVRVEGTWEITSQYLCESFGSAYVDARFIPNDTEHFKVFETQLFAAAKIMNPQTIFVIAQEGYEQPHITVENYDGYDHINVVSGMISVTYSDGKNVIEPLRKVTIYKVYDGIIYFYYCGNSNNYSTRLNGEVEYIEHVDNGGGN